MDQPRRRKRSPGRSAEPVEAAAPAASTVAAILRRHGRIALADDPQRQPCRRFERATPDELWQMDFKGHLPLARGHCRLLTAVDGHSRHAVLLAACADERGATVRERLTGAFRRHGLPFRPADGQRATLGRGLGPRGVHPLGAWLLRLGIKVHHGRPCHPQTQGKEERFHLTEFRDRRF